MAEREDPSAAEPDLATNKEADDADGDEDGACGCVCLELFWEDNGNAAVLTDKQISPSVSRPDTRGRAPLS